MSACPANPGDRRPREGRNKAARYPINGTGTQVSEGLWMESQSCDWWVFTESGVFRFLFFLYNYQSKKLLWSERKANTHQQKQETASH